MGYIRKCQSCGSTQLVRLLDLGRQPICNKFLHRSELKHEKFYPLRLIMCKSCQLVQLSYVPPASEVFGKKFNYLSSSILESVNYFTKVANELEAKFNLSSNDYVVDIGSNDGVFLKPLAEHGIKVLGIDPAPEPSKFAIKQGIPTIIKRFEDGVDDIIRTTKGRVKLLTAFNVMAHTDTIHDFLNGVKKILDHNPNAVFISQSHYLRNLIVGYEYDTIYHEHARYYSLTSLEVLFKIHHLKIYDVGTTELYGGSIIAYADLGAHEESENVALMKREEKRLLNPRRFAEFAKVVMENRIQLKKLIDKFNREGKEVIGIGAPMKSTTLLNYCGLGPKSLRYLTELNPLKVGTLSPGMHIPVVTDANVSSNQPEVALILSWNAADRIIRNFRDRGYKGSFIVPIPFPRVVK